MNSASSWVKLPNGESFALNDIQHLGEIKEKFDDIAGCPVMFFEIELSPITSSNRVVKCEIHDIEDSFQSAAANRTKLESFRERLAAKRWGMRFIGIEKACTVSPSIY